MTAAALIETIARLAPASAVGASLLFYFGWVRAHAQAASLGYDISLAGLSKSDYLLRSVPVLFVPILVLLVVALGLIALDKSLVARLQHPDRTVSARRTVKILRLAPIWFPILGLASMVARPIGDYAALPISLTLGVLAFVYGRRLSRELGAQMTRDRPRRILVGCLLVMLLFWDVERVARSFGESYADLIISRPQQFVAVALFSNQDLDISQPGVVQSFVGGTGSSYRFRYDGLRLMNYSNNRYFLLTSPSGGRPVVLVIPDVNTIRVEFDAGP